MQALQRVFLTVALTFMWSPSFLFIKLAVEDLPPLTIAASRVSLAALLLSLLLAFKKRSLPICKDFWLKIFIMAILSSALPFYLFCYAEQTIDSALAALLNGCTPMFTALLAQLFIPSDRLDFQKSIGILLGAFGILFLFMPNLLKGVSGTIPGMGAALTAAFSYAASHVFAKKYITGYKPFVVPTAQLLASSLLLIPLAILFEKPQDLPFPQWPAIGGVCGLAFFGTFCAFILYYKLMESSGPTAVSMTACFFPIGGLILGIVFLKEEATWLSLFSALMILLGMLVVNKVISIKYFILKLKGDKTARTLAR